MKYANFFLTLALTLSLSTPVTLADEKKTTSKKSAEKTGPGYDKTYDAFLKRFKEAISKKDIMTMTAMMDPVQVEWSQKMAKAMIKQGKAVKEFKEAVEKKFPLITLFQSKDRREYYMYFYMMSSMEQMGQMMSGKRPMEPAIANAKLIFMDSKKVKDYYVVRFKDIDTKTGKENSIEVIHAVKVGKYWRIFPVNKKTGKREKLTLRQDSELKKMYLMAKHAEMMQKDFAALKKQIEAGKFKSGEELGQVLVKLLKESRKKLEAINQKADKETKKPESK